MSIYITGDTHGTFDRFSSEKFPEGDNLTRSDSVIVAGDFGLIWDPEPTRYEHTYINRELFNIHKLSEIPFTILFLDGNHDNHNRLHKLSKIPMFGGIVGKVSENIFYLRRGEIYTIEDKTFFTFGGALSRDIILYGEMDFKKFQDIQFQKDYLKDLPEASIIKKYGYKIPNIHVRYLSNETFDKKVKHTISNGRRVIVLSNKNGLSYILACRQPDINWWSKEVASSKERQHGLDNLKKHYNKVDYIISHTPSKSILDIYAKEILKSSSGFVGLDNNVDPTEAYLDKIYANTEFKQAYSGHMHDVWDYDKYHFLFERIEKIL